MDEKARLQRFGIGAAITLVVTIGVAVVFGSFAASVSLAIGFGATLLAGGGRAKR